MSRKWTRDLCRLPTAQLMHRCSSPRLTPAQPEWLQALLQDQSDGPRLYSWTTANLPSHRQAGVSVEPSSLRTADERRRIYILGIGNIGTLFATSLAKLKHTPPITLVVHRKALLEHWAAEPGIEMTRSGAMEKSPNFDLEWWTEDVPTIGPRREIGAPGGISNLIVTTKAPAALPQVDLMRRYLGRHSTVAFVQNGMSKLWPPFGPQYSDERYGPEHPSWIACVTMHGVTSLGPFRSWHAALADVYVGPLLLNLSGGERARYLIDAILNAPHLAATEVARPVLWVVQAEKLVVNCVVNPLTAILGCRNGGLFVNSNSDTAKVMDILLKEASDVLRALIQDDSIREVLFDEGDHSGDPGKLTKEQLLDRFSFQGLRAMLYKAADKIKDNTSSMLQDVRSGKRTEIQEFNGWLIETANYLSGELDVTNHKTLVELVKNGTKTEESQLRRHFPTIRE